MHTKRTGQGSSYAKRPKTLVVSKASCGQVMYQAAKHNIGRILHPVADNS